MLIAGWSAVFFLAALLASIVRWRGLPVRQRAMCILSSSLAVIPVLAALLCGLQFLGLPWRFLALSWVEVIYVFIASGAFSYVSMVVVSLASDGESPTLRLVAALEAAAPDGLSMADARERLSVRGEVMARLDTLLADGWAEMRGERCMLTSKGRFPLQLARWVRRIAGLSNGLG